MYPKGLREDLAAYDVEPTGWGPICERWVQWPIPHQAGDYALLFIVHETQSDIPRPEGWCQVNTGDLRCDDGVLRWLTSYYRYTTSASESVVDIGVGIRGQIMTSRLLTTS